MRISDALLLRAIRAGRGLHCCVDSSDWVTDQKPKFLYKRWTSCRSTWMLTRTMLSKPFFLSINHQELQIRLSPQTPMVRTRTNTNPYGTETNTAGWRGRKGACVLGVLVWAESLFYTCLLLSGPACVSKHSPQLLAFRSRRFIAHHCLWLLPALRRLT